MFMTSNVAIYTNYTARNNSPDSKVRTPWTAPIRTSPLGPDRLRRTATSDPADRLRSPDGTLPRRTRRGRTRADRPQHLSLSLSRTRRSATYIIMVIEGVEQLVLQLLRRERHLWSRTTGTRKPRDLDRRQRSLRPSRPPTPPSLTGDRRPPTTDNDGDESTTTNAHGIVG